MRVSHPPVEVFCIYAHKDAMLAEELMKHLQVLQREGLISTWHDRNLAPGMDRSHAVGEYLRSASIILILISPDFLASDVCLGQEMQFALERSERGEARVIPIIMRPCDWDGAPFAHLQCLPRNRKPITAWRNRDQAFSSVTSDLRDVMRPDQKLLDDLGLDFKLRQQAISRVARADPENIQEVAASQLSIINSYYQSGLQQSQQSFHWSLIWGGIGLSFLIAAVSFLLLRQPTDVALASGIGGAIVEVFAATYLYLYKHASDQLAAFRASLEGTQRLLLANSMCERLEGEIEQNTRAELIRVMVNSVVNSPPSTHLEKKM